MASLRRRAWQKCSASGLSQGLWPRERRFERRQLQEREDLHGCDWLTKLLR